MCVFLLSVLIVLNLCIFLLFLHCVLVYMFTFYCHAILLAFLLCTLCTILIIIIIIIIVVVVVVVVVIIGSHGLSSGTTDDFK